MTEILPSFLDAVFVNGRIIAKCGFCNRVHVCLDDPNEALPELPRVDINPDQNPKDAIEEAVKGYDDQQDYGVNSCYHPDKLVNLIARFDPDLNLPGMPVGILDKIAMVFRCDDDRAKELAGAIQGRPEGSALVVPHFGAENLATGILDGKGVVEGCCEHILLKYQTFIWTERAMIGRFVTLEANRLLEEAKETKREADKIAATT